MTKGKTTEDIIKSYVNKEHDFGFTTIDEAEEAKKDLTIEDYKVRMEKIEELIMPLLANLHSSAKNPTIYWPNRKEELEKKMKEFLSLTRGI